MQTSNQLALYRLVLRQCCRVAFFHLGQVFFRSPFPWWRLYCTSKVKESQICILSYYFTNCKEKQRDSKILVFFDYFIEFWHFSAFFIFQSYLPVQPFCQQCIPLINRDVADAVANMILAHQSNSSFLICSHRVAPIWRSMYRSSPSVPTGQKRAVWQPGK